MSDIKTPIEPAVLKTPIKPAVPVVISRPIVKISPATPTIKAIPPSPNPFIVGNMWMFFCENFNYFPNSTVGVLASNVPNPTLSQLGLAVQGGNQIARVYFAPTSDDYIVTDGKTATAYQNPPADLWAAVQNIIAGGYNLDYISWVGDGVWAVFGSLPPGTAPAGRPPVNCILGSKIPPTLTAQIASNIQSYDNRYSVGGVIFAPSGEWFLEGSSPDEHGEIYNFSSKFPADIQTLINSFLNNGNPTDVYVNGLEFDPDGGWILVDTTNKVYYGGAIAAGLQQQIQTAQGGGQNVNDVATLALNCPIFPIGYPNPILQPNSPPPNNFDVLGGGHGAAMNTALSLDSGGNINATTILQTSNAAMGFHGMVIVTFLDFTGAIIPELKAQVAARFGIDNIPLVAPNQNTPNPFYWTQTIPTSYLQQIRAVAISHIYSPNSFEQDLANWSNGIGSDVGNLVPQSVATLFSGGKGSSKSSG